MTEQISAVELLSTLTAAREQLEGADTGAVNVPSDKEPSTRALVGIGYALLVIAQELSFIRQAYEEVAAR